VNSPRAPVGMSVRWWSAPRHGHTTRGESERLDIDVGLGICVRLGICVECAEYGSQHWVLVHVCADVVQTGKGDELRIRDLTRRPLRSVEEVDICCADEEEAPELPRAKVYRDVALGQHRGRRGLDRGWVVIEPERSLVCW
jgi:hypothetical protein